MTMSTIGTGVPSALESEVALRDVFLSSALTGLFRGRFCEKLLPGRTSRRFDRNEVLYDVGDVRRSMFFLRKGFVKIGTVTREGREIIYDIRREGDVVGELSALQTPRRDRAVALEASEAIEVAYPEIVDAVRNDAALFDKFIGLFGDALAEAYDQITAVTTHDLLVRVGQTLLVLGSKSGGPDRDEVEIQAYLTQEDIAQMVGARRERVSTALNTLRRRGLIDYSPRGRMLLHAKVLRSFVG